MNKEKQKIIADICPFYKEYGSCDRCNTETEIDDPPCYFECMANAIIDNNYRKQSEGEWVDSNGQPVKFNPIDGCPEKSCYCSACGEWLVGSDEYPCNGNFCPNCGAKMKGGAE